MTEKRWTIQEILNVTTKLLKDKEIDSPRVCAEILLSHQLKKNRIELYLRLEQALTDKEISGFRELVKRRLKREPLQYITGHREFWSIDFFVNPSVLIPRPETELLVEEAIKLKKNRLLPENSRPKILDLGTGSGVIAITLAKELNGATILATDISLEAIATARHNAERSNVSGQIHFCNGDLLEPFQKNSETFDMIISNPPYISSEELSILAPEISSYEPKIALDGQENGMYFIEKIIERSSYYLKSKGWLLIEMDPGQTEKALDLIDSAQSFDFKERIMDYGKRFRLVKTQKKNG